VKEEGPEQMNGRADLGRCAVAGVRECLGIDAAEHSEWSHGFSWLPSGREQRVWAAPAFEEGAAVGWRVHVRTGLSPRFDGSAALVEVLQSELPRATLSGVVRDADDPHRLQLASSLRVHRDNRGWALGVLEAAARLQVVEACRLDRLARSANPASEEPAAGRDADESASRTSEAGPDVAECLEALRGLPGAHVVETRGGLMASLPFGEAHRSLLELRASGQSPALGPGLSVVLTVPGSGGVRDALELNEGEIAERSDTDLLGSWSARRGARVFTAFFPAAAWGEGLGVELARACARRAGRLANAPTSSPS
jgi:hypothetical protein